MVCFSIWNKEKNKKKKQKNNKNKSKQKNKKKNSKKQFINMHLTPNTLDEAWGDNKSKKRFV